MSPTTRDSRLFRALYKRETHTRDTTKYETGKARVATHNPKVSSLVN